MANRREFLLGAAATALLPAPGACVPLPKMGQNLVLIDVNAADNLIWRIIHPDDDSEIIHHAVEPGTFRVYGKHADFPLNEEGRPLYRLKACLDVVEKYTGVRPLNGDNGLTTPPEPEADA